MNTGGPAFPQHGWSKDPQVLERMRNQGGMTLLDWFAGQALTGILADSESQGEPEDFSAAAYNIAESMLAEKARREAVVKESSTTDHSGEVNKMVELEVQNRELLERIKRLENAGGKMAELLDCYGGFNETEEWACSTRSQHIRETRLATEAWAKAKGQP